MLTQVPSAMLVIRGAKGEVGSVDGIVEEGEPNPDIPETLCLLDTLFVKTWGLTGSGVGWSPFAPSAGMFVEQLED